ncbi:unnamed protein product [Didymodactylos carnosus]|uniref:Uncharacterized protein n=1 Tax=Didymodactylos carnosus TaxID=1234261 RepID=A0A813R9K9_9BILA|nr:unnamed protein product [Didymodactylos carnosus]CAF0780426.1 unnamed protein product [Didymodactylos carnosus]CAF3493460.1 unnamed protein product [Didymodactylos carnosus]CAF3563545.1 unnamed protein product [Didymodactylos carnosus]
MTALLQDPTIQKILGEVNKAASGGALGQAGAYSGQTFDAVGSQSFYQSNGYPSNIYDTAFDSDIDLSTPSIPMTNGNFNLYSGFVGSDQFSTEYIAPFKYRYYGHYQTGESKTRVQATPSATSSVNNGVSIEQVHSSFIPSSIPNLGLNVRIENNTIEETLPTEQLMNNLALSNDNTQSNHVHNNKASSIDIQRSSPADGSDPDFVESQSNSNLNGFPIENLDQQTLASAGKIYYDPNPQIIKRQGIGSVTYKQNILIRFLQPPPIPAAGPLIIKEVRRPQPPPLPPLVIKQRPTPPKTPPPLILRERPPPIPQQVQSKIITRQLPAEPPPPRAVIIERLPPLPPKPRDIIIERWLPYQLSQKRKVLVQRAPIIKEYLKPKNVIIIYEPVQAQIIRQFQKLGVVRQDPKTYINRYGAQLQDAITLEEEARKAGVTEDINPPSIVKNGGLRNTYGFDSDTSLGANELDEQLTELGEGNIFDNGSTAFTNEDEQSIRNIHSSSSVKRIHLSTSNKTLDEQQGVENRQDNNGQPFYINNNNNNVVDSGDNI